MRIAMLVAFGIIMVGVVSVVVWLPAHSSEDGVEAATAVDAAPAGLTGVDVIIAEPLADVVEELEYGHEHS
jgi:hypothetical protein